MTRTRSAYASRNASPSRRSSGGVVSRKRSGGAGPQISIPIGKVFHILGLLVVALGVAGAVLALVFVALPFVMRGTLSLMGVGALPLIPALGFWYWHWQKLGAWAAIRTHLLHVAGSVLLYTGLLGLAALVHPTNLTVWGVSLTEASLGGLLGQLVLGEGKALDILRTFAISVAGFALVFPPALPQMGRVSVLAGRFLWGLGLHRRAWQGARWGTVSATRAIRSHRSGGVKPTSSDFTNDVIDAEYEDLPDELVEQTAGAPIQSTLLPIITPEDEEDEEPVATSIVTNTQWGLPPMDVLDHPPDPEVVDQTYRARQLEDALLSYGVEAKVVQIHVGPAVTQFGVEPGWDRKFREIRERDADGHFKLDKDGNPKVRHEEISRTRVKVERITGLSNNIALAMAAPSVRIEAPVPGKQVVGIEVPNVSPAVVPLHAVIESPAFQRLKVRSKLAIALGKGVAGEPVVADLTKMPHLLIAGATGSGKSVCINAIVTSVLMHATPDEVRVLMVDPKRVELVPYNTIPHLLAPVIVEPEKVVGTLNWVIKEMEDRYRLFASIGVRNIEGYSRSPKAEKQLPYWVVIIDELADLMMVAPFEVERALCRLAQLARATGIHLVVATQRPSVDVITGLIKANFPTRISFAVTSYVDSRTILDAPGAEKLLGRGDMLFMATDAAKPKRVQGTYISDAEVERIVDFWSNERFQHLRPQQFAEEMEMLAHAGQKSGVTNDDTDDDDLMDRARELAETSDRLSTSFLQRRLRIGYPRAARIMEALQDEGYGSMPGEDLP